MITDDPDAVTLYDLNGFAALALAKAVQDARYSRGWPDPETVRTLWLSPLVRSSLAAPHKITARHVARIMVIATAAGVL